jgi:hypothetical protein
MKAKWQKFFSVLSLLMIVSLLFSAVAFADPVNLNPQDTSGFQNTVKTAVNKFAGTLQAVIGVIAAAFLMWGGLLFITASGRADKIEQAKDKIKYGLIGVVVAYLADKIVGMVYGWIS